MEEVRCARRSCLPENSGPSNAKNENSHRGSNGRQDLEMGSVTCRCISAAVRCCGHGRDARSSQRVCRQDSSACGAGIFPALLRTGVVSFLGTIRGCANLLRRATVYINRHLSPFTREQCRIIRRARATSSSNAIAGIRRDRQKVRARILIVSILVVYTVCCAYLCADM